MATLLASCQELYGTRDLYQVLGIKNEASGSEVKRAYHKLSLQVHPDKVKEDEKDLATNKFQALGKVYSILSDKEKRAVYDETGEVDDENDIPQDRDWYDYWRLLFAKISFKDIEEFESKYKGSEEELNDLKSAYMDYEGDMDSILENVLCATVDDDERFREILEKAVKDGELPEYGAFKNEKKTKKTSRKQKASKEAKMAAEYKEELGLGDGDDALRNMILQRKRDREGQAESFFAHLEAKYASDSKKKKSKPKKS